MCTTFMDPVCTPVLAASRPTRPFLNTRDFTANILRPRTEDDQLPEDADERAVAFAVERDVISCAWRGLWHATAPCSRTCSLISFDLAKRARLLRVCIRLLNLLGRTVDLNKIHTTFEARHDGDAKKVQNPWYHIETG